MPNYALMNAIVASILSMVMTWTVTSKSSVSGSGTYPSEDMSVHYTCTYQKGDVRAGDTATIRFSGLHGTDIERVEVYVRSNKTAGAGTFSVWANGEEISSLSGSFKDWTGSYDNENYLPITLVSKPITQVDELMVRLIGTANSLHIEKYVIQYVPITPHTVTLMCGNEVYSSVTEQSGKTGVLLPVPPEVPSWEFAGWSETEFWDSEVLPTQLIVPGETYYPREDAVLWAVYRLDQHAGSAYVTDLADGVYMYVNSQTYLALSGVPVNGVMASCATNPYDSRQHFRLSFNENGTQATLTHAVSETPIGFNSDAKLTKDASIWNMYHDGEQTLLYAVIKGQNYILWPGLMDGNENYYAGLYKADPMSSPIRLQSTLMPEGQVIYTCHPEAQGIETPREGKKEQVVMHFGPYQLIIRNGQKVIRVW